MRAGRGTGQLIAVNPTDDGDARSGPGTVDDGDGNGPSIAKTDVQQGQVNGAEGAGFDAFPIESNITPFGRSVPLGAVLRLVFLHRFIDGGASSFGEFMGHADFAHGFLLPVAHDAAMSLPVMNAPFCC